MLSGRKFYIGESIFNSKMDIWKIDFLFQIDSLENVV